MPHNPDKQSYHPRNLDTSHLPIRDNYLNSPRNFLRPIPSFLFLSIPRHERLASIAPIPTTLFLANLVRHQGEEWMDTEPCIPATASFTGGGRNSITIIRDYPPTWGRGDVTAYHLVPLKRGNVKTFVTRLALWRISPGE